MHKDLTQALMDAWEQVKPRLLRDPDELRARLARRRQPLLTRPPRACCLAVRANDTRINPATACIVPEDAVDRARYCEHEVTIDARLLRRLCRPIHLAPLGQDINHAARLLGTTPSTLHYGMRTGGYRVERIFGLNGKRVKVPLVWRDDELDPGSGNLFRPVDAIWGSNWAFMADRVSDDFAQDVVRTVQQRRYRQGPERFRGWQWICPGCKRRVRTIYYPVPAETLVEYLRDERRLGIDPADALAPPAGSLACHRCHRIRYWTYQSHSCWNQFVAYFSAGLMYGKEVRRPEYLLGIEKTAHGRKRAYRAHRLDNPRGKQVMRGLLEGKKYERIAGDMGIALATVQGHVRRLYRRHDVHSRAELIEKRRSGELNSC